MIGWTTWGTEPAALAALGLLLLAAAPGAAAAGRSGPRAADPADLDRHLDKAEKVLGRAEGAVRGRDPGRVALLLKRVDDEVALFEERSRLKDLKEAIDTARDAARGGNSAAVAVAVNRARAYLPGLADYAVLREAESAARLARAALEQGDTPQALAAVDRLEGAVLPAVLLRRLAESREAVARARAAMVRRDMQGGAREIAAARRALDGLRYAGALSRAVFGLSVGADLMQQGALVAARDQVQRALRDLREARNRAPGPLPAGLGETEATITAVWRRSTRPEKEDPGRLQEASRAIEAIRSAQG
jgi:hypothetical protein